MQQPTTPTRKKFLLWGTGIFSAFTLFRFFNRSKKAALPSGSNHNGKVKMLTRDGQLVEIDKDLLAAGSKKITNEELQQWITKNQQPKND